MADVALGKTADGRDLTGEDPRKKFTEMKKWVHGNTRFTLLGASELKVHDLTSSDPYARIWWENSKGERVKEQPEEWKSPVQLSSLNCLYNVVCDKFVREEWDWVRLGVHLYDFDVIGKDDFMGECYITCEDFMKATHTTTPHRKLKLTRKGKDAGYIHVYMKFEPQDAEFDEKFAAFKRLNSLVLDDMDPLADNQPIPVPLKKKK